MVNEMLNFAQTGIKNENGLPEVEKWTGHCEYREERGLTLNVFTVHR